MYGILTKRKKLLTGLFSRKIGEEEVI